MSNDNSDFPYLSFYYLKSSLDETQDRTIVISRSIFKFLIFLWIFIWFVSGLLNLFPQIPWGFGFIYYVFEFLAIPAGFISAYSYNRPFINIVLVITIVSFLVIGFATGLSIYTVAICYINNTPANCQNMQFTNILMALLSIILFIVTFILLLSLISIARRLNNAVIFKKVSNRKKIPLESKFNRINKRNEQYNKRS